MNKVKEYFNADPAAYHAKYQAATAEGYAFRVRQESLLKLLGPGHGQLLDIGCGPGVMTTKIRALGWHYLGIDLAPEMIRLAISKFKNDSQINFKVGSVDKLELADNSFDAIVAMGLVEYLDHEAVALAEIRRVLKPDGRLLISVPNWWSPARMWDRWLLTPLAKLYRWLTGRGPSNKLHHREYKIKSYIGFLQSQGYKTRSWETYNYRIIPRPFDFWWPKLAIITASWAERYLAKIWCLGTSINLEVEKL